MCSTLSPTRSYRFLFFFFFNDTATTEIYTLSLHDALPIWMTLPGHGVVREMLQLPDDVAPLAPLHEAMVVNRDGDRSQEPDDVEGVGDERNPGRDRLGDSTVVVRQHEHRRRLEPKALRLVADHRHC